MDSIIEMQKIINALFDETSEDLKDKDGKNKYYFRAGDAIKFYDKGNKLAGRRLRRAMKHIRELGHKTRMEISQIVAAEKESHKNNNE